MRKALSPFAVLLHEADRRTLEGWGWLAVSLEDYAVMHSGERVCTLDERLILQTLTRTSEGEAWAVPALSRISPLS